MAAIIQEKERRVIPNWRPFDTTISLGELGIATIMAKEKPILSIDKYIHDFKNNQTVPFAADLLSAFLVNGLSNVKEVTNAAHFILSHEKETTTSQKELANRILFENNIDDSSINTITFRQLSDYLPQEEYRNKIGTLKQYIINFPYNSILWVELSRCYSILGQEKQAMRAMRCAVQLSPNNRFVVRCATRLFSHYDEPDLAQYILRNCNILRKDPWLISAEISISTIKGKISNLLKHGIELINSNNYSPFSTTELAAAIATVQLLNGDRKKSRRMFTKSLISPNDNSIAQIEWVLNNKDKYLLDKDDININSQHNYEAMAIDNFYNNNLNEALDNTCQWFCDMPFSKRPVMMGSFIAELLDQKQLAIMFLKKGLISNVRDNQILNNIAYYSALNNDLVEANNYIQKVDYRTIDNRNEICITATKGLIKFRELKFEEGRKLYLEAINKSRNVKNKELSGIAILNYAREEILAKSEHIGKAMELVSTIENSDNVGIATKKLYNEVIDLYQKYTSYK